MTKCDFCIKYDPKEGCILCGWPTKRAGYCEQAITRMENALRNIGVPRND